MWPLRPTAIATPGATASSIAVFTSLSSFPARAGSSPELLRPSSGSTYLTGVGGAATTRAGVGAAHANAPATAITTIGTTAFIGLHPHLGPVHARAERNRRRQRDW